MQFLSWAVAHFNCKISSITLHFDIKLVSNWEKRLSETIWSCPVNFSFVTYKTQKLRPQRILVKTTQMSDHLWSAIFSVIVYFRDFFGSSGLAFIMCPTFNHIWHGPFLTFSHGGGGGMRAPPIITFFLVIVPMIIGIKFDVFYTMVTRVCGVTTIS